MLENLLALIMQRLSPVFQPCWLDVTMRPTLKAASLSFLAVKLVQPHQYCYFHPHPGSPCPSHAQRAPDPLP